MEEPLTKFWLSLRLDNHKTIFRFLNALVIMFNVIERIQHYLEISSSEPHYVERIKRIFDSGMGVISSFSAQQSCLLKKKGCIRHFPEKSYSSECKMILIDFSILVPIS